MKKYENFLGRVTVEYETYGGAKENYFSDQTTSERFIHHKESYLVANEIYKFVKKLLKADNFRSYTTPKITFYLDGSYEPFRILQSERRLVETEEHEFVSEYTFILHTINELYYDEMEIGGNVLKRQIEIIISDMISEMIAFLTKEEVEEEFAYGQ